MLGIIIINYLPVACAMKTNMMRTHDMTYMYTSSNISAFFRYDINAHCLVICYLFHPDKKCQWNMKGQLSASRTADNVPALILISVVQCLLHANEPKTYLISVLCTVFTALYISCTSEGEPKLPDSASTFITALMSTSITKCASFSDSNFICQL